RRGDAFRACGAGERRLAGHRQSAQLEPQDPAQYPQQSFSRVRLQRDRRTDRRWCLVSPDRRIAQSHDCSGGDELERGVGGGYRIAIAASEVELAPVRGEDASRRTPTNPAYARYSAAAAAKLACVRQPPAAWP